MTDESITAERTALDNHLRQLLPRFELARTALPLVPEIALWLFRDLHPDRPLDDETVNTLMETPPYWTLCWASGQVLARHLLDHPELVRGRTVLDFGAGSGVVAIAAALAGAGRVLACDDDPVSRRAIRVNAAENGAAVETLATLEEGPVPDLITAADILYDRRNLPLLGQLAARAEAVLLADSRIPDLDPDGYTLFATAEATTWPDPGEDVAFNHVRLFGAGRAAGEPRPEEEPA
jgi:predicted nicotinamide N-methyase